MLRTDLSLHAAVSGALRRILGPAASQLTVKVQDGVVTLSGVVDTPDEKVAAERTVKRQPGVHAVVEALQVANNMSGGSPNP
jgi:osmotically-inducible protein OsmY